MSNETMVQNGAGHESLQSTSRKMAEPPNSRDRRDACPTRALVGKIARLPKSIREEFNRRVEDGQPASEILPWVNGLPEVKQILEKHFRGVPISDANLSQWRRVGFKRWQEKQESLMELKFLAEDAKDFSEATGGNLARGAASVAAAKILKMLQGIPATPDSLDALTKISYAVTALMNAEQAQVRLEYEKTRVFQGNERLVLSWDKFLRDRVATAQRALNDQIAKDIQAADIDNGEKIELLGRRLFGKKWQGRVVGKKEEKKEAEDPKKGSGKGAETNGSADNEKATQGGERAGVPPHPSLSPIGGEGNLGTATVSPAREKTREAKGPMEKTAAGGSTVKEDSTADQEVRPTMTPDNSTEAKVSPAGERVETKQMDAPEKGREDNGGDFTIAATKSKEKRQEDPPRANAPEGRPAGSEISGGLPTAATSTLPNPKPKTPVPELSPYEKAIQGGQTFLSALYAQFSRVKNAQPKLQEDPPAPKPSPWDAFSEPVKAPQFALQPEPLRSPPEFNAMG